MNSIEDLNFLIDQKIKEENDNVSSIYMSYIQPFCSSGGKCDDFLVPKEILVQFPPGTTKIRRYFLQILILMGIFHSQDKPDPLPDNNMKEVLLLISSIAPLAPLISETMLLDMFEELNSVHGEIFPQSIIFLMKSIGITEDEMSEDSFEEKTESCRRIHYEDGKAVQTGLEYQPNKTVLQNYPLFQGSGDPKKNKIKKPKHAPEIDMKSFI